MLQFRNAAFVCAVVGCAAYISSLDCDMCFDDETAIIKNRDLRPSIPWSNILYNDFWGKPMASEDSHKSYRPLTVATFRLNYMLHELQPLGYHLVNVLLHSAVCYLYVLLCGVVFSEVWPALIAGLLFAVHPIHTEAVAGLVGRAELLSAVFFIGSFLAYRKAVKATSGEGKWVCVSILLCLCSALSKEQGITALAVCLFTDFFIYQRMTVSSLCKAASQNKFVLPTRLKAFSHRAFFLAIFLVLFMFGRLQLMKTAPSFPISANPAATLLDAPYRQLHWTYLTAFNTWLLLSPSQLSPEYAGNTIPLITSFIDARNLATVATIAGYCILGVFALSREKNDSRKRVAVIGLVFIVLPYLPASNLFFPVGFVVAERVLYLPSMGFCMLVGYGAHIMWKSHQKMASNFVKFSLPFLLLLHTTKTVLQNRVWLSEKELYISALRSCPANGKMWHNLGTQLDYGIDIHQSEWLMRRSISVEPSYIPAYSDLGTVLAKQNRREEAEKVLTEAIGLVEVGLEGHQHVTISRSDIQAYVKLASIVKMNQTRLLEALKLCQLALERIPEDSRVLRETGHVLLHMGQIEEAKLYLLQATEAGPTEPNARFLLGVAEGELGNLDDAERSIRHSLTLSSGTNSQIYASHLDTILQRKAERGQGRTTTYHH